MRRFQTTIHRLYSSASRLFPRNEPKSYPSIHYRGIANLPPCSRNKSIPQEIPRRTCWSPPHSVLLECSTALPRVFACKYPGVFPPVRHHLHRLAIQRVPLQLPHDRPASGLHPSSHLLPHTLLAHSAPHMPSIGRGTASAIHVSGPITHRAADRHPLPVPPPAVLSASYSTPPRPSPCLPELPHTSRAHRAPHTPSAGRGAIPPSRASGPITLHLTDRRPLPAPSTSNATDHALHASLLVPSPARVTIY